MCGEFARCLSKAERESWGILRLTIMIGFFDIKRREG